MLAVENSKLLRDYTLIDSRFRDLCYIVKHWAKMRKVNDPYRGTLSSYAYVLMVLHYLQTISPPVLPCLQRAAKDPQFANLYPPVIIQGFDCTYANQISAYKGFGAANKMSIGALAVRICLPACFASVRWFLTDGGDLSSGL